MLFVLYASIKITEKLTKKKKKKKGEPVEKYQVADFSPYTEAPALAVQPLTP
jgi:hypothetical protein